MAGNLKPARLRSMTERGKKQPTNYVCIDVTPETAPEGGSPILLGWIGDEVTCNMLAWHASYQEENQESIIGAIQEAVAFAREHGYCVVGLRPEIEIALTAETGGK